MSGILACGLYLIYEIYEPYPRIGHTPSGHRRSTMCASISSRKCFSTDVIGECAHWPSPQMEVSFIASDSSSTSFKSAGVPFPCDHAVRMSTIFCDPIRHGTHFPHDSLRKNVHAFSAMSSMQVPSAHTTIAPEPSIDPIEARDLKSRRTSTIDAGR